jgi:thiol-disulfide isomerase/thioredoxin
VENAGKPSGNTARDAWVEEENPPVMKYSPVQVLGILLVAALVSCAPEPPAVSIATPGEIKARIEASTAPLVLVHVWATWCVPCIEEFPELMKVHTQFEGRGLELILVSGDDPDELEPVEKFLLKQNCPVGSLVSTDLSQVFIETLSPNWAGALPASFFYADGKLLHEWEGKRTYQEYAEQLETMLN